MWCFCAPDNWPKTSDSQIWEEKLPSVSHPPLHRHLRGVPSDDRVLLVFHDGAAHARRELGEEEMDSLSLMVCLSTVAIA